MCPENVSIESCYFIVFVLDKIMENVKQFLTEQVSNLIFFKL